MDRDSAREQLRGMLRDYVQRITPASKGKKQYVCPICGSGTGKKGTGAFTVYDDSNKWQCFACGKNGDIFDLIGHVENLTGYNECLARAAEIYGVAIDQHGAPLVRMDSKPIKPVPAPVAAAEEPETDYTSFFLQAHKHINETDYPQRRGLSAQTIDRFNLGYVPDWIYPSPKAYSRSPRLIIPTSATSYMARDIRENVPDSQKGYIKQKVGHVKMLNIDALQTAQKPIFVVEGEIDALSIIDVGGEAIALGSTTGVKAFLEVLKSQKPDQPLIIALDNDEAGEKAAKELENGLAALDISFYRQNPAGKHKDANEALQADRDAFAQAVASAEAAEEEAKRAARDAYMQNSAANRLEAFVNAITASVNTPCYPTGFDKLDTYLDGGLYPGLYALGAITSLGKTTFIMQIADQTAQLGNDVLIFSLEMSRYELMARSVSRHTISTILQHGGDARDAKTMRGILDGKRYEAYSASERELINRAIAEYGQYAQHVYISEGIGDIGVDSIRRTVRDHISFTGKTPVVIVDYLQILAPYDEKSTDKQNTDKAVLELKRISRDYKIPVIAISSFNRLNYKTPSAMEAFKESGAIEYSCDVLIGLQLKGTGEKDFDVDAAKKRNPREVELKILKNRSGKTGDVLQYNYYAMFNFFVEV